MRSDLLLLNWSAHLSLFVFLAVDLIALGVILGYLIFRALRRHKIRHFGDYAESVVADALRDAFPGDPVLNDIFLPYKGGSTQLDHVLICKWGVFVIETKSHNGKINTEGREWVQFYQDKVVRFHSPLEQNKIHVDALQRILQKNHLRGIPVKGVVVFTSRKVFFTKRHEGLLRLEELSPYIKTGQTGRHRFAFTSRKGKNLLSKRKIHRIAAVIKKAKVKSRRVKRDHKRFVQNRFGRR